VRQPHNQPTHRHCATTNCRVAPTRHRPGLFYDATASIGQEASRARCQSETATCPMRPPAAAPGNPSRYDEPSLPPGLYVNRPPASTLRHRKNAGAKHKFAPENQTLTAANLISKAPESFHGFRYLLHLVTPCRPPRRQR
jgi:hypothetical protein